MRWVEDKKRLLRGVLFVAAGMLIPILLLLLRSSVISMPPSDEIISMSGGWDIYYRGRMTNDAELSSFEADGIIAGERVTIGRYIPQEDLFAPSIMFKTRISRVRVYLDGEQIYSYGHDIPEGKYVPKAWHMVHIPTRNGEGLLKIEITAAQDSAFSGLYRVYLGNAEDLTREFIQIRRFPLIVGSFMIYFGFLLAVLSPLLIFGTSRDRSVMFSACISILLGVYILGYNDLLDYFLHDFVRSHETEYLSMYLIPPIFIGYVLTSGATRNRHRQMKVMAVADLAFVIIVVLLHYSGYVSFNYFLPFYHVLLGGESMYLLYDLIQNARDARDDSGRNTMCMSAESALLMGLMLFVVAMFVEIIRYYVLRFAMTESNTGNFDFATIGALAIVLSLMLNYFFHSVDHLTEARTRIKLYGMAFTDALTGIDNRASCDQFMASLTEANEVYTVVSIDLDGLKTVNDKQGHSIGDMMISGFGALLKDAFSDCELVGRMGGDEFMVIKKGAKAADLEKDLNSLKLGAEEENRRGNVFKYLYSYGTADSSEGENVQAVYMLADSRMYEMKEEHHRQRGILATGKLPIQGGVTDG
ncbi:MAG: GGDEF domain-containing protein [Lachnospiraceae bacterium]|nr:GGDEF domain-containing protein [Lachnospiraceae bacterium]